MSEHAAWLAFGTRWLIELAAVVAITLLAVAARALDRGAALAAIAVGTVALASSLACGIALLAFVVTGSALAKLPERHAGASDFGTKGGQRDAAQVIANGGVAAACALAGALLQNLQPHLASAWFAAAIGALAAAAGDTWSAEIGERYGGQPRLLIGLTRVKPGMSGGVTLLGLAASLAGGALVGLVAGIVQHALALNWVALGAAAGLVGSVFDSLLGASVQGLWRCEVCERLCETSHHHGESGRLVRGLPWMSNDLVNFATTAVIAAAAFGWSLGR